MPFSKIVSLQNLDQFTFQRCRKTLQNNIKIKQIIDLIKPAVIPRTIYSARLIIEWKIMQKSDKHPPGGNFEHNYEHRHIKHRNQVSSDNHSPLLQKISKKNLQKLNQN